MRVETKEEYLNYLKYLNSLKITASPIDEERHSRIINSNYKIINIKMQTLRNLSKEIAKDGYLGLYKYSTNEYYEDIMIQGLVIGRIKDKTKMWELIDIYKSKIDTWALTDSMSANMLGFKNGFTEDDYKKCETLAKSNKEFEARLGLILLFQYALSDQYIDRIIALLESITNHAYYVDMMVAWTLAEIVAKYENRGIAEIKKKCYTKFVQNKAISKCRDSYRVSNETKELLKQYRIK